MIGQGSFISDSDGADVVRDQLLNNLTGLSDSVQALRDCIKDDKNITLLAGLFRSRVEKIEKDFKTYEDLIIKGVK